MAGAAPTGKKVTVKDLEYTQFEIPAEAIGKTENLIFNNNNNGEQCGDLKLSPVEAHDYYVVIENKTTTVVDPQNPEPEPEGLTE